MKKIIIISVLIMFNALIAVEDSNQMAKYPKKLFDELKKSVQEFEVRSSTLEKPYLVVNRNIETQLLLHQKSKKNNREITRNDLVKFLFTKRAIDSNTLEKLQIYNLIKLPSTDDMNSCVRNEKVTYVKIFTHLESVRFDSPIIDQLLSLDDID